MSLIIELQDTLIQVVDAQTTRDGRFQVDSFFSIPLSEDQTTESPTFQRALKDALLSHNIHDTKAHIVFNNRSTISKEFDLPPLEPSKMTVLVRNEMKLALNLGSDYVYNYMTLSSHQTHHKILAFALKKSYIAATETWLKALGIGIRTIQTSTSTMINMIDYSHLITDDKAIIVCDIQTTYNRFYLYHKQELVMIRTIYSDPSKNMTCPKRFIKLSQLLIHSIDIENELQVHKMLLVGHYDMILNVEATCPKTEDFLCELANLNFVFTTSKDVNYYCFNFIGAMS